MIPCGDASIDLPSHAIEQGISPSVPNSRRDDHELTSHLRIMAAPSITINGNIAEAAGQQEGGEHFQADASDSNYILLCCTERIQLTQSEELERLHVKDLVTGEQPLSGDQQAIRCPALKGGGGPEDFTSVPVEGNHLTREVAIRVEVVRDEHPVA